jgi:hypothetical protein
MNTNASFFSSSWSAKAEDDENIWACIEADVRRKEDRHG